MSAPRISTSRQTLTPIRVAADLSGATVRDIESWIADGSAYTERIKGIVYVGLDDVMALASRPAPGGGGR
jgi:hypothetical protein